MSTNIDKIYYKNFDHKKNYQKLVSKILDTS